MNLLLYYFANSDTGYGHYYRSTALARVAHQRGHNVTVAGDKFVPGVNYLPTRYNSFNGFLTAVNYSRPDWIIVDLPHTQPRWIKDIAGKARVCTLNGIGYNQNDGADLRIIQGMADVQLPGPQDKVPVLKGLEYVIIRPEIEKYRQDKRSRMTFVWGGAMDALGLLKRFTVVCPDRYATLITTDLMPEPQIILPAHTRLKLDGDEFLTWLGGSHDAVIAFGMIAWEAVYLGIPVKAFSYSKLHLVFAEAMHRAGLVMAWPEVGLPASDEAMKRFITTPFKATGQGPDTEGARRVMEAIEGYG